MFSGFPLSAVHTLCGFCFICTKAVTSRDVARMITEGSDSDCSSLTADEVCFTSLNSESGKCSIDSYFYQNA